MKKNLLMLQNRELFDKLQFANQNIKRLKEENATLKEKLAILSNQLEKANTESVLKTDTEENLSEIEATGQETNEDKETPSEFQMSAEAQYGATAIGDIVLQSVRFSNRLNELNKNNVKELVNLILGKTEVAKSEILNIVLSESALDNKLQMIDTVKSDTIEYFESILEQ